jgi:hypothetical protein
MKIITFLLFLTIVSCSSTPGPKRNAPIGKIETDTCVLGSKKLVNLMQPQEKITIEVEYVIEENCEGSVKSALSKKMNDLANIETDDDHEVKPERYWDYHACYTGTERIFKKYWQSVTSEDHSRVRKYMMAEINQNYKGEEWNDNYLRVREEVCKDAMVELSKVANGKE